jgi:hypothetical protein
MAASSTLSSYLPGYVQSCNREDQSLKTAGSGLLEIQNLLHLLITSG